MAFRIVMLLGFSFEDIQQPKTTTSCRTLFNLFKLFDLSKSSLLTQNKEAIIPVLTSERREGCNPGGGKGHSTYWVKRAEPGRK